MNNNFSYKPYRKEKNFSFQLKRRLRARVPAEKEVGAEIIRKNIIVQEINVKIITIILIND